MKERILELLDKEYDALDIITINDKLGLTTVEELQSLQFYLDELISELEVYLTKKNKYILFSKCPNFKKGIISVNKKGFGFLNIPAEERIIKVQGKDVRQPDIHIAKDKLGFALDGDFVLVEVLGSDMEHPEGKVIKILKRDLKNIVGTIKSDGNEIYFESLEPLNIELSVDKESLKKCVEGEVVVVSLLDDLGKNRYIGEVSQHICHKDDASQDILTIAAKYEIYHDFPEDAMKQAEETPEEVRDVDREGRVDLTDKEIFTIDGADTKDIDDAISIEMKDGYYHLGVHIADVSYYVTENSPLDVEALRRGTSSYLADAVIPQLPHKLSNGICSLNPNVDRCAISCMMKIDSRGKVVDYEIFPSIIRSKKKMTYTSVNHYLMENVIDEGYENFTQSLSIMKELADIIRDERTRRGASDFDIDEPKVICDETGKAIDVVVRERGDGEKLIEDFMVIANETVASYFITMGLPSIYRVHDVPKQEKVESFIRFCGMTGHPIKGKFNKVNPKTFQKLLEQIDVEDDLKPIYRAEAVKSMAKAIYSQENIGHFGLASRNYTHFTSPIRRYPDLLVHRLLRHYLFNGKIDERSVNYWNSNIESIARQSSEREVAAVEAEREVTKMKMAEYMEQHVGEEYEAIVSGVGNIGMFVQLPNMVEGLIPMSSLDGDYFEYDDELKCLFGRSSKKRYMIGDKFKVKCIAASKANMTVDFEMVKELRLNATPKGKELKLGRK